ncbi:MAG: glycosyltransferase family 39 protein [Solirubrobacteraceae bacterium]|jgi:4-amino-4-deoxy-L-arabinose transferase-like glycosyltransferase
MLIPDSTGVAAVARDEGRPWSVRLSVPAAALIAVTALAAVLRFATIANQSYWYDEAATVHLLRMSFGAMLHGVGTQESTPPLYYVLAWLWAKVFGTGEAGLRSLSALAGTAVIPIAYLCGRELISRWAGLLAGALAAVNPFMIWYSQEARSYMLLAALCGASLWCCARAWRSPSSRTFGCWAGLSALALATHFFAGFLVAPEALVLLWRARSAAALAAAGAVAAVQAALVPLAVGDTSHHLQGWITQFPLSIRIQQVPVAFAFGTLYQSPIVTYGLLGAAVLAGLLIVLLVIGADGSQLRGAGLAAALAGFVVLAPLVLAFTGRDYYIARNLMPAWVALAVLIGGACTAPRARVGGALLAVVLIGACAWAQLKIERDPSYQRPDVRGVAAALGAASGPRAIVAFQGAYVTLPLALYLRGADPAAATEPAVSEVDVVCNPNQPLPTQLPAGARLLASHIVGGYMVRRFAVAPAWPVSALPGAAAALVGRPPLGAAILIQRS